MSPVAALIYNEEIPFTTGIYVRRALEKRGYHVVVLRNQELRRIYQIKPEFVLAVDDGSHYIYDINYHPALFWVVDTHVTFDRDKYMVEPFDMVFVAQKEDVPHVASYNPSAFWLPLACDPEDHGRKLVPKKYQCASVGNGFDFGFRAAMKDRLEEKYKCYIGRAPHEKIGEIYSSSDIVINYSIRNDLNMRIFEAICSGSMLITKRIIDNGFDELFEEGRDAVAFDGTIQDLMDKVQHYLTHSKERETIAANGMTKILVNHTYDNRLSFILSKLGEIRNVPRNPLNMVTLCKLKFLLAAAVWIHQIRATFGPVLIKGPLVARAIKRRHGS